MIKKIIISFLYIFLLSQAFAASPRTILFLPFINEGNYRYDKLKTYIPHYLYVTINNMEDYTTVSNVKILEYMTTYNIIDDDLKRLKIVFNMAEYFQADYTIHGCFSDNGDSITVNFRVYYRFDNDFEPEYKTIHIKLEDTDYLTLNKSFDDLIPIVEEIIEHPLDLGHLTVRTSPESCILFIDQEPIGETPLRFALTPGDHRITIVYKEHTHNEVILDETIQIEKNNNREKNINIYVPLEINADEECTVFINGMEKGHTNFKENLFWGRTYQIKVFYYKEDGEEYIVYEKDLNTKDPVSPINIVSKAILTMHFPHTYSVALNDEPEIPLPHTYTLIPGTYKLQILLYDPEWHCTWYLNEQEITLSPFDKLTFNRKVIGYRKKWYFLFLPSALQFYNKQPKKGWLLLSAYIGTAAITGICAGLWSYYYVETKKFNEGKINIMDDKKLKNARDSFFIGILTLSALHLYSAIDGVVTMNHLYSVIYR